MEQTAGMDLRQATPSDKRNKTIQELHSSEVIYVTNLNNMIEGYILPLKQSQLVPQKVVTDIFQNIETIYQFHKTFLEDLESLISNWHPSSSRVGELFLSLAPYFKLYTQYCSNYDKSINVIQMHKKTTPKFEQFLTESQASKRFKGTYITSHLILPIQRIPRYEMFLRELVKRTENSHPDFANLNQALETVTTLAAEVNEACIKAENIQKIMDISKRIGMENLLSPTRKFLYEETAAAELEIHSYTGPTKIYLFNDLVIFTVKKAKTLPRKFLVEPLHLCWVQDYKENSIQIVSPNDTYVIKFSSPSAMQQTVNAFVQAIAKLVVSNPTYGATRLGYTLTEDCESGLFLAKPLEESEETSHDDKEHKKKRKTGLLDQWKKELSAKRKGKKKDKDKNRVPVAFSAPIVPTQFKRLSLPHDSSDSVRADIDTGFLSARTRTPLIEARSSSNLNSIPNDHFDIRTSCNFPLSHPVPEHR